jgi:beta-glucosidase
MNAAQSPSLRASELLAAMSLANKISMVTGGVRFRGENPNLGSTAYTAAIPSLCVPALVMNDGSNGIGNEQQLTTAFPDTISLAATWEPQLAQQYGQVLAGEALAKGVNVLLAPGVDIARNPLGGRNFEYLGEDPFLTGQLAAAMVGGIQSRDVISTVKHFALNDQETNRTIDSSDASERTMQEIDLPAFDVATHAGAGAVMCAYNRINGVYACENPYTLEQVLDDQFAFTGFTMSDWHATHSTAPSANAGLDLEMPAGEKSYGAALQAAVTKGQVSEATLDGMVYRILYSMFRVGLFDHVPNEGLQAAAATATNAESIATATQIAENGTVLLKNAGAVLPLGTTPGKRIAVFGPAGGGFGAALASQGYGSGHVPEQWYQPGIVPPFQAIAARAALAGDTATYSEGYNLQEATARAASASVAVVLVNDVEIEGADRPSLEAKIGTCSFVLPFLMPNSCIYFGPNQNTLVTAVAAANPHTIVVVQSGDPIAMQWLEMVQGVVENWYPGQVDGNSIAPILFGDVDPSGKLPITFPARLSEDSLQSAAQYPGVMEAGDSVGPHSLYSEELLVGYRWYDAKGLTPLFPFGFGLSYTTFGFSGLSVTSSGDSAVAAFTLTNTGSRPGADTAQVYVGMPTSTGEPPRQLKGFSKLSLNPGQSQTVSIPLSATSFAHWETSSRQWVVSGGAYQIYVGDSSRNLPLHASLELPPSELGAGVY